MEEGSPELGGDILTVFTENFIILLKQHREMVNKNPSALEGCKEEWKRYRDQVLAGVEADKKDKILEKFSELIKKYFPNEEGEK